MSGIPPSQIRAPLFSRAALASSLLAGAFVLMYVWLSEAKGPWSVPMLFVSVAIGAFGGRGVWRLAREESESLPLLKLERSWRLRPAFLSVLSAIGLSVGVLALERRVVHGIESRQAEYDAISVEFEGQEYAPHYNGNMMMSDEVLPEGLHRSGSWDRTRVGSFVNGKASGEWKLFDLDGRECGRVTLKDGEPYGPCEFWDATGKRRVCGAYKGWLKRIGLWTLDNVLGEGRKYVLYGPGWTVE